MTQQTETRIDVREAIAKAREYIQFIYEGQTLGRLMLEEVELDDREDAWMITYGFDVALPQTRSPLLSRDYIRHYKIIAVDATTGEVKSMKIRHFKDNAE